MSNTALIADCCVAIHEHVAIFMYFRDLAKLRECTVSIVSYKKRLGSTKLRKKEREDEKFKLKRSTCDWGGKLSIHCSDRETKERNSMIHLSEKETNSVNVKVVVHTTQVYIVL